MIDTMLRVAGLAAALVAALAVAQSTAPGDAAAGREQVRMCQGCHGIEGWRTAFPEVYRVPRIGGQHEAYLVQALRQYKSGERSHASMRAIASTLSDKDIADLAAFYGRPDIRTASQR